MSIERLMELVPPPQRIQRLPINWDRIESTLGIALPVDYKQLAELYGPGVFADSIVLYAPTSKEEFDLLTQTRRESEFFRSMIEGKGDTIPCTLIGVESCLGATQPGLANCSG